MDIVHDGHALVLTGDFDVRSTMEVRSAIYEHLGGFEQDLVIDLSGGTPTAARLHVARTVIRRAERSAWAAYDEHGETMNPLAIRYLNRLSDLVFILARYANRENGDVLWVPGGER